MANLRSAAASRINGNMAKGKGKGLANLTPKPPTPIPNIKGSNNVPRVKTPVKGGRGFTETPKPFQPGFMAGKSGKVPPGLAKAAANRLARKNRAATTRLRGVKWR